MDTKACSVANVAFVDAVGCGLHGCEQYNFSLRANPQTTTSEAFLAGEKQAFGKSNIGGATALFLLMFFLLLQFFSQNIYLFFTFVESARWTDCVRQFQL